MAYFVFACDDSIFSSNMAASMEHGDGGSGGSSSVSDSSDDDKLQRLKEAAVTSDYPPVSNCMHGYCNWIYFVYYSLNQTLTCLIQTIVLSREVSQ